jgi:NodT family efflux transporter outer membrane factor (OMF) lipoprotein
MLVERLIVLFVLTNARYLAGVCMSSAAGFRPQLLASAALILGMGALSGCMVGPNFVPPRPAEPSHYLSDAPATHGAPYVSGGAVDPEWWNSFQDPELTALESQAVAQNLDLQIATQRLLEAEAQAQIEGAVLYPNLSGGASYTREGPSKVGVFAAFGTAAGTNTAAAGVANGTSTAPGGGGLSAATIAPLDLYQYGLQSTYDLDLWGKNRRAVEAAVAAAAASEQARRASLLNVEAQVANYYLQLRGTQRVLDITRHNLAFANQLVSLTLERQEAGLTTALDVANARATQAQIQSQIPGLIAQRDAIIDQIGLLLGETPDDLPPALVTAAPIPATPPVVPVGLPSSLLLRRPDVREAVDNLHEMTAEVGVAEASFFPDIALSGSVSFQALQFKNLNQFRAITYAVGPNVTIPLFEGGQLRGQLKLRKAQQTEAAVGYAKTVLTAFYQVNTALVAYTQDHATVQSLKTYVQQSQIAVTLAEEQYRQGLVDYLTVLNAQQTLLSSEQQEAQAEQRLGTDLVTLYQALGGGWEGQYPVAKEGA